MTAITSGSRIEASLGGERKQPGFLRRLLSQRFVPVAIGLLAALVVAAVVGPILAAYGVNESDPRNALQGPSLDHWLGTDQLGRDVFTRLLYGSRVSILVGVVTVALAMGVGIPLGLVAGYYGRLWDASIMRMMDVIIAFPSLVLALAIIGIFGAGTLQIMVAIASGSFPVYARLTRGQVLSVREEAYIVAARSIGVPTPLIIWRHLLPNTLSPLIVQGSLGIGYAILAEAGLSFLGLGVPSTATWGGMLSQALDMIQVKPSLAMYPGLAIFITVLAINTIGDAIRDVLDPRLRGV